MRFFRPCFLAGWLYPDAFFRIKTDEKLLFLSFDDGPDPYSTPGLLEILKKYGIKALFFCNGRAAEKYPELVKMIISEGHIVGNHGNKHMNGWITPTSKYIDDVIKASAFTSSRLFRPPYGRMTLRQYRKLKIDYKILFWDLMPYDFDISFGVSNSLRVLKENIRSGSVIVFHDSRQSLARDILPEYIDYCHSKEFRFALPPLS
jgi:peptidoglycan/xylan/chitin deacetylase (PgdA/CDA1 family)